MRGVRQAVNRMRRAGYTVPVAGASGTMPADEMARRYARPTRWRDGPASGGSPWRWAGSATRRTASACWSSAGTRGGGCGRCCSFVPWGADGLSLDLMRRDRDRDNGLMEFMVIELRCSAAPRWAYAGSR